MPTILRNALIRLWDTSGQAQNGKEIVDEVSTKNVNQYRLGMSVRGPSMLTVLWHDRESAGYTDLLPDNWFLTEGSLLDRVHSVKGPRSGIYKAKCNVKVNGAHADLDYESFAQFNRKHEMYLGIMRVRFEDADRARVTQILWKDKGSKSFKLYSTTVAHEQSYESTPQKDIDLLEISTIEGRKKLVTHLKRERSPKLIAAKKAAVFTAHGTLACEVCAFTFEDKYGELGKTYCEVHHRKPLSSGDTRKTSLSDLAILCSNCHRMIHRTDPMLSVEKFRETCLTNRSPDPRERRCAPPLGRVNGDVRHQKSRQGTQPAALAQTVMRDV